MDALHDHLATIYPGMKAPSFRCSEGPEAGSLILHYYSDRPGLESIVIGIVKAVGKKLHNTDVEVKVLRTGQGDRHGEFLITERNKIHCDGDQLKVMDHIDVTDLLSLGISFPTTHRFSHLSPLT